KKNPMLLPVLLGLLQMTAQTADSTAARVYAAVLDSFYVRPTTTRLLVRARTVTGVGHVDDVDYANGLKGLRPLADGLQEDFEAKRRVHTAVPPIPARIPTTLVPDSVLAR